MAGLIDRRGLWHSPLTALAVIASMILIAPTFASAQIMNGQPTMVRQGFTFLSWTLEGDETDVSIKQWYVPIIVNAAIQENWELSLYSSVAGSDANWSLENDQITGLTDSRVQIARSLANDRVLLSGGVSIPTGQTELNDDERSLLRWLTSDFFTFPVKYHGEGLNLYGGIGGATTAGAWALGLAGAMHVMGQYTPYADGPEYTPGSRFVLTGSAERRWATRGRVSADVSMIVSGNDESNGEPVFSDGTMFDIQLQGQRRFDVSSIDVAIRLLLRGKNAVLDPVNAQLVSEENNNNGSDFRFHVRGRRELSERLGGWLSLETRFLAANDYAPDDPFFEDAARIMGIGGGIDVRLGPQTSGGLGIRIWNGSSDGSARFEQLDLKGFEITQRFTLTI